MTIMVKRKKRRAFGSSAVIHTQQAAKASDDIQYAAVLTVNKARNGRCTAATMAYAEMQQAIGRFDAHNRSGGKAWKPQSAITFAADAYNQHCVRESTTVSGRRRKVRR
jgi:hypothetical protein